MPTLNWIGKEAVVNHYHHVPFHLLKDVPDLACGDPGSGNLIVQGDNLVALKALLPYYAGRVKCIYIDPPYNTGNEGWAYNDNVDSPVIRRWLRDVVGKEGETLDRHDRWLCTMYPRLLLLRQFLREDGAIFISLDDNEIQALRYVMDEIFGEQNFVATVIWQKMDGPKNTAMHLSEDHDYIVLYAKDAKVWRPKKLPRTEVMKARYKNPDNDPRGPWLLSDLAARNFYAQGRYPITTKTGRVIEGPPAGSYWRVNKERFDELERDGRIWWGKSGDNRPGMKRFLSEVQEGVVPQTLWPWKDAGSTRHAKQELSQLMAAGASQDLFITPKPVQLLERILQITTNSDDLILDSFAGSGTTGHATLRLNKQDNGTRRFILVEMEPTISRSLTAERVRRVAQGHINTKGERIEGLGGGFRFCELGEQLFDEDGKIREHVRFPDLARHVYFTETGEPLPRERVSAKSPLVGIHQGRAVCLLYNGILKDKSPDGGNALTQVTLALLCEACAGHRVERLVVYGTSQRLSPARLKRENVTFKQIPYSIRTT